MKIRLAITLSVTPDRPDEPEGPSGTESLVIHQDQQRYVGFRPAEENGEHP